MSSALHTGLYWGIVLGSGFTALILTCLTGYFILNVIATAMDYIEEWHRGGPDR